MPTKVFLTVYLFLSDLSFILSYLLCDTSQGVLHTLYLSSNIILAYTIRPYFISLTHFYPFCVWLQKR